MQERRKKMSGMLFRLNVFGIECGVGDKIEVGFDSSLRKVDGEAPILLSFTVQECGKITVQALRTLPELRVVCTEFRRLRDVHRDDENLSPGTCIELKELPRDGRNSFITLGEQVPKLTWHRKTEDLTLISKVTFSRSIT
jgi:hypothetical protein